jgi:hypothetical protein
MFCPHVAWHHVIESGLSALSCEKQMGQSPSIVFRFWMSPPLVEKPAPGIGGAASKMARSSELTSARW